MAQRGGHRGKHTLELAMRAARAHAPEPLDAAVVELPGAVDEWRGVAVVEPAAAEADPRAADADPTVGRESTASRTAMRRDPPWDRRAALSRVPVNFTFDKD